MLWLRVGVVKEWVMVTKLALVRTWSRERAWLSQWCAFLAVALPWMSQPVFSPANQVEHLMPWSRFSPIQSRYLTHSGYFCNHPVSMLLPGLMDIVRLWDMISGFFKTLALCSSLCFYLLRTLGTDKEKGGRPPHPGS